jgi:hypothetical protein
MSIRLSSSPCAPATFCSVTSREARDGFQVLLQFVHQLERALRQRFGLQRVCVREARKRGDFLVDARVVFHRARAERVEADIDAIVALRQARVVAQRVQFTHFGQGGRLWAQILLTEQLRERLGGHIAHRGTHAAPTRHTALENQRKVYGTTHNARKCTRLGARFRA